MGFGQVVLTHWNMGSTEYYVNTKEEITVRFSEPKEDFPEEVTTQRRPRR